MTKRELRVWAIMIGAPLKWWDHIPIYGYWSLRKRVRQHMKASRMSGHKDDG